MNSEMTVPVVMPRNDNKFIFLGENNILMQIRLAVTKDGCPRRGSGAAVSVFAASFGHRWPTADFLEAFKGLFKV